MIIQTLREIEIDETVVFFGDKKDKLTIGSSVEISYDGKVYGTAVVYQILGNNNYKAARTA